MHALLLRHLAVVGLLLSADASSIANDQKPPTTHVAETPRTCEARTINYITDSLPQLCLKSSWSVANGSSVRASNETEASETGDGIALSAERILVQDGVSSTSVAEGESTTTQSSSPVIETEAVLTDLESGELNEASFLSFEEWKKQTLDKAGQSGANIGSKKSVEGRKRETEGIQNHLESLGDEGEIDLDFGAFRSGGNGEETMQTPEIDETETAEEPHDLVAKTKDQYPSKDAGKTCKERFSYASFDAGATVLKTHAGAKNAKSVLIENKDDYMLSECSAENKFIIIELSEDIWIDTLVLANYEFFSSMFRTFRVSVSDRWPVKMEKWKDVGTYEARNSREIQPFLIPNPQIWARYIRIEFLSHYGNEYYCPLSLVRVHVTRMLESWKETEGGGDDDSDEIGSGENQYVHEAIAEAILEEERLSAELKAHSATAAPEPTIVEVSHSEETASTEEMITPWERPGFYLLYLSETEHLDDICLEEEAPSPASAVVEVTSTESSSGPESEQASALSPVAAHTDTDATEPTAAPQVSAQTATMTESQLVKESSAAASSSDTTRSASDTSILSSTSASPTAKSQNSTSSARNKTTSTSSAPSSLPTIQESFFKGVSRRLQLLETNSTLSLKYIEEQSKILREAFTKVEKKQLQKTTTFLDTLNTTVLEELRGFRQQYDEIWQSTVISLESQRDESRREILAISTRLNILADEVIFQKRMSIVQSVLLLLCLGLVIFSRVSGGSNLDFPTFYSRRERHLAPYPSHLESPLDGSLPASPDFKRADSGRWPETGHRRQLSDDTAVSRSRSRGDSPPTPISSYSHSEEQALTPPSGVEDLTVASVEDLSEPLHHSEDDIATARPVMKARGSFVSRHQDSPDEHALESPLEHHLTSNGYEYQEVSVPVLIIESPHTPSSHLPSPPPESSPETPVPQTQPRSPSSPKSPTTFSIARKPLPALPPQSPS